MKAIILCAGFGTRLPDVSKHLPKVMVEIDNKPLLQTHIENLRKFGINEIAINLHYLPEKIQDYFKDGKRFGVNITYSFEKELLGTGGALVPLNKFIDEDTFIIYGDVVMNVEYGKMLDFHKNNKAVVTAAVHETSHPHDSDLVVYDTKFRINKIIKKPHKKNFKNPVGLAALYIINPNIKKYFLKTFPFDIAHDLLPILVDEKQRVYGYNTGELIMDIGTPERLEKIERYFSK